MGRRAAVITLITTLVIAWGSLLATQAADITPRLGLDLQGGFEVRLEAPSCEDPDVVVQAVEIMRRRIEALGGVQEPEIAVEGDCNVLVQLPGVSDRDRALDAIGTTGQLEFRPVRTISPIPGLSPVFFNVEEPETPTTTTVPGDGSTTTTSPDGGTTTTSPDGGTTTTTAPPDTTTTTVADTTTTTGGDGTTTTAPDSTTTTQPSEPVDPTENVILPEGITWCDEVDQPGCVDPETGLTPNPDPDLDAFLATDFVDEGGIVYHLAPAALLGSDLDGASAQFQQSGGGGGGLGVGGGGAGEWIVLLDFNSEGGRKFAETTAELAGYPLGDPRRQFAIVLDSIVQSAPQVAAGVDPAEGITGGTAVITLGSAENQQSEASQLAVVLRYGSLPVAFEQSAVQSVSATLGEDSLQAGLIAGIGGLLLVAIAMIAYYRALGVVNVIGLTVFGSLMVVAFSLLGEWQGVTLTLAGVAGVIVAVGITSDSYIVYYERIKEEVHRGRSLRAAIDHAFSRSIRTILTADTVSFIGATLLFFLAVGAVKGFALALLIATIIDVLVAVFFTRPAVALLARSRLGEGGSLSIRGATGRAKEVEA